MKLTDDTRVTTPDGFLTSETIIDITGFRKKNCQAKRLEELGINFREGRHLIYVRVEDYFGNNFSLKEKDKEQEEPDFSVFIEGSSNGKKGKRPSYKGANKKEK